MDHGPVEHEAKFLLPSPEAGRQAFARVLGARMCPGSLRIRAMHEVYLDTADWTLRRAGLGLRLRWVNGCVRLTLKSAHADPDGLARRFEIEETLPPGVGPDMPGPPPGPRVAAALARLFPPLQVQPILRLRKIRTEAVRAAGGAGTIEVAFDLVRLLDPGPAAGFAELELELRSGDPARFSAFAVAVGRSLRLKPDPRSKLERGLLLAGRPPPVRPRRGDRKLDRGDTFLEAARKHLAVQTERLCWFEPGVRSGVDPEAVHQARIALRRLRAALRVFRAAFDPGAIEALKRDLRWLARELGRVRDLDVARARLREDGRRLPASLRTIAEAADAGLAALRRRARARLLRALDAPRTAGLLDALRARASGGTPCDAPPAALEPVRKAARRRVRRMEKRVRRAADAVSGEPTDAGLHALRIRGKNLRYAHQFFADIEGKRARRAARRVKRLTDALGEHQDALIMERGLRSAAWASAARRERPEAGADLGPLADRYGRLAARLRRAALAAAAAWRTGKR